VALKSSLSSEEKTAEIEEALDALDKLVDRLKVMYEQYFMGIQKQAPAHLHTDAERRIRDVAQMQIRNTALRYRFATIQQKFGAYNTYWKRTLREIESGRYLRNLSKLRRQVQRTGEALPEEILAAMPKRMRDAIERDRAVAIADAKRRNLVDGGAAPDDTQPDQPRFAAPTAPPPRKKSVTTDPFADAGEEDIAAALSSLADEALAAIETHAAPAAAPPRAAPPPPPPPPPRPAPPPVPSRPAATVVPPVPAFRPASTVAPPVRPPAAPSPTAAAPPAAPAPPTVVARPAPRPARTADVPGMTEAETRALYAKFVKAREVVGDKSEGFSYDKLVRTLQSQAPKILEQHKAQKVEFNVVIRDNKVILKAKPR